MEHRGAADFTIYLAACVPGQEAAYALGRRDFSKNNSMVFMVHT